MKLTKIDISECHVVDIAELRNETDLDSIFHDNSKACYITSGKILIGVISPTDYLRYKRSTLDDQSFSLDNIINKHYKRIYNGSPDYEKDAYEIIKSIRTPEIPVVDFDNTLLYFLKIENLRITSITDNQSYPDFCANAATDSYIFNSFRKKSIYKQILEHVSEKEGIDYLEFINTVNPKVLNDIHEYVKNDLYGGAEPVYYDQVGYISPSTLRYIAVLADIERRFGNLDGMKICEIGVGYGGQCRILASRYNLKSYALVDLPQVLALAKRYLNCYPLNTRLLFSTMNELNPEENYDLFISNYAFSEIRYDVQECYFMKTIARSAKGYILYNDVKTLSNEIKRFTLEDYEKRIPGLQISGEILPLPATHSNRLLCWGC